MKKQNDSLANKSLINSNNNIIILNNISMNNLNNISFDYLSKIGKNKYNNSFKNFDSMKMRFTNHVSKKKDDNITERNKELEKKKEYYNNQKILHKKKNNYKKCNRIKEQNLNGFNLKQIKNKKCKKDFTNKNKFISHNKINSSINFNYHGGQNAKNEYIHRHNYSNNFNIMINTNKINNNIINMLNQNYSTYNSKSIENFIKNLRERIKKGKEKSNINSEQISPKKAYNRQNYFKNNNLVNPIKTFRYSHKMKKTIIKDNNKEKNIVGEFNNYFGKTKKNRKNCLSELNEKTIEEIKNFKSTINSI